MTPKQKAQELYDLFGGWYFGQAARGIPICTVLQIINANPHSNPLNDKPVTSTMAYWQEVLTELKMM